MDALQIFEFERDFAGSLRCIPMVVRFKLDQSGVKLSLRQWSRFGRDGREQLVRMPCAEPGEIAGYRAFLIGLIEACADEPVKTMEIDSQPEWACVDHIPGRVLSQAEACSLEPPSLSAWCAWTPLQRFALYKLTRTGHDNDNFGPALLEFTRQAG